MVRDVETYSQCVPCVSRRRLLLPRLLWEKETGRGHSPLSPGIGRQLTAHLTCRVTYVAVLPVANGPGRGHGEGFGCGVALAREGGPLLLAGRGLSGGVTRVVTGSAGRGTSNPGTWAPCLRSMGSGVGSRCCWPPSQARIKGLGTGNGGRSLRHLGTSNPGTWAPVPVALAGVGIGDGIGPGIGRAW